jgi:putative ABC transport system permease protein
VATLMTGVAVMSMFAVVLATAGVQGERELAENFPVDFVVSSVARSADDAGHTHLPDAVPDTLRARPEFRAVARTRETAGLVDGADTVVAAVESPEIAPEVVAGSLADLTAATVALRTGFAGPRHLAVGDTVQMGQWPDRRWPATVVALIDDSPARGDALISWTEFGQRYGDGDERVLVRRAEGLSAATARGALDTVLRGYPFVSVQSAAERRDALRVELDKRLVEFGGLLAVSALIAVVGIMDTLALSVVERERESALLRALGLSAGRLRRTLVIEAVLTAVTGGLAGAVFGAGSGWVLAAGLIRTYGHGSPVVPVGQLALFVGVAALAGVVASLLPARRAGRTAPTAAG